MAETIVESGVIRNPLDYYQELANQLSSWTCFEKTDQGPVTRIYQLHSAGVKRLAASVALCPDGIRTRDGEPVQLLVLVSAPLGSDASGTSLTGQVLRLLGPISHRDLLLDARTTASAWSAFLLLEAEKASADP